MTDESQLPETKRRQIFEAVVQAQDTVSVAESRQRIAKQFGVTEGEVRQIEREGIDNQWPPLDG